MYTVEDIQAVIASRNDNPAHAWLDFHRSLTVIGLGTEPFDFGRPRFVAQEDEDFVFSITNEGETRYFRKHGYLANHFGKVIYSGSLVEVEPTTVTVFAEV